MKIAILQSIWKNTGQLQYQVLQSFYKKFLVFNVVLHLHFLFTNLISSLFPRSTFKNYVTFPFLVLLVFFYLLQIISSHILQQPFQDPFCHFSLIMPFKIIDFDLNELYLAIFKIILVFPNFWQLNNLKFIRKLLQLLLHKQARIHKMNILLFPLNSVFKMKK